MRDVTIGAMVLMLQAATAVPQQAPVDPAVVVAFDGSTPCGEAVRRLLRIPLDADAHLIEWSVVLNHDPKTGAPSQYRLDFKYGLTVPNTPGLGDKIVPQQRTGSWRTRKGTSSNPAALVYELDGAVSLQRISDSVVHIIDPGGSLMVGTGGWSYTLNRRDASEPRVDSAAAAQADSSSRTLLPVATGETVFGIFEGRTPCQGIARELGRRDAAGCTKVKWRFTLFQDPATREPTTYRIESTLHHTPREGSWRIERGLDANSGATIYHLGQAGSENTLLLLKGDENVLFLLDRQRRTLTGNAELSYTIDRRIR